MSDRAGYEAAAKVVYKAVKDWKGKPLRFLFPPRDVALLAGVDQVEDMIADSDGARELIAQLVELAKPGEPPTAMMLRVVLELLEVPIVWITIAEFAERGHGVMVGPL